MRLRRSSFAASARARRVPMVFVIAGALAACAPPHPASDAGLDLDAGGPSPHAIRVVSFTPGAGAGFGADLMPDVVLGPPIPGESPAQGSLDVVSLGRGGAIVLELGIALEDGDGPDLLVFENPFQGAVGAFYEAGEVAVSTDGAAFTAFPCAPADPAPNGCAGYGVVHADVDPTDPDVAGGDAFDLADLPDAVDGARYVRIVDVGDGPTGGDATGFDLDAIAVVSR